MLAQLQRLTGILRQHSGGGPRAEFAFPKIRIEFSRDAGIDAVFGVLLVDPFAEFVETVLVGVGVGAHGFGEWICSVWMGLA